MSFYPSITEDLLSRALDFAKNHCNIDQEQVDTVFHARRSLLFEGGDPWVKQNNEHFDVTEGSYDGAEICELVGLYLLSKLQSIFKSGSVGCYRDDGLAVVKNMTPRLQDRLRKEVIQCFKDENLQITIETNLTRTDFLDVWLDLHLNKYYPYRKPNDNPVYVHSSSNHPPNILKQIPKMTSQRLSALSCNETEFDKVSPQYEEILKKSGFSEKLVYVRPSVRSRRRRNRQVLWYNPPFDRQVKSNVGKTFLDLIDRHFPPNHRLRRLLNRSTVKVSYSCMPNVDAAISSHNSKILSEISDATHVCNCRNPSACPFDGECQTPAVIYQGDVIAEGEPVSEYVGLSEPKVKERASDHHTSFNDIRYENKTELSKRVWELKLKTKQPVVKWRIVRKTTPYKAGANHCNLCLWEKYHIMKGGPNLINKRDELVSTCRHKNKFLLKNFKERGK